MQTYTILGAGGAIGSPLAELLIKQGKTVRLLSRSGHQMSGAESRAVDVFDLAGLTDAVRGSMVVFLLVGLEYNTKVWVEKWELLMKNVLKACGEQEIPLIFFDNVYMYGQVQGQMTEQTPFNPCSKKGEVRAKVATLLLDAVQSQQITASIARAADFYGPWADKTSMLHQTVIKNLAEGRKAQWLGDANQPHSNSYTLDCARALQLLADDVSSYNQTWHVPTFNPPPIPTDLAKMAAEMLGKPFKGVQAAPKWLVRMLGIFFPLMREMPEMMYQSEHPYWFDSSKFEQHYDFKPTSYEQGISETIAFFGLKK